MTGMNDQHKGLDQDMEELSEYLKRRSNSIHEKIGSTDEKEFIWEAYNKGLADGFSLASEWIKEIIERRNNND